VEIPTHLQTAGNAPREITGGFSELFQAIPDAISVHNKGILVAVNSAFERMFGVSGPQAKGRSVFEFVAEGSKEIVAQAAASLSAQQYEIEAMKADGSTFIAEIFSVPTLYEGFNGRLVILRDITERKRAEHILQGNESRFRALTENSTDRIALVDATGVISYSSPSSTRIYGYTQEETIGRNAFDFVHPEDMEVIAATFNKILQQPGQPFHVEYRSRHKDGHYIWMDTTGHNALANPFVRAIVINEREITERKRSEERIYHLASIVDSSDDAMIGTNHEKQIVAWNRAAEELFGYSSPEIIGQHISILIPPDRLKEMVELGDKVREGEHLKSLETVRMAKGGRRVDVSLTLSPACDVRTGKNTGAWGIVRDITEKKRLEREIVTISEREQHRIGHDLHDGLCQQLIAAHISISSLSDDLKEVSSPFAESASRALAPLASAIAQGKNLAKSLFPVLLTEEGLGWALKNLAETTCSISRISCSFESTGSALIGDNVVATHLYRMAQEAVSNAVRHARATAIVIRLDSSAEKICLSIEDDGVGMPANAHRTGMGLHILQYRANAIEARLEITSPANGGTRIDVTLSAR
jgi:PAS domain S-box-containing protein